MDSLPGPWDPVSASSERGSFAAELSMSRHDPVSRKSRRVPVEVGAALRQRGASGVSVQVTDLSIHGFRAATHLELQEGTDVWLRLPKLEPYHAKVAWSRGQFVGCEFVRPLHPAVLDMIVATAAAG